MPLTDSDLRDKYKDVEHLELAKELEEIRQEQRTIPAHIG